MPIGEWLKPLLCRFPAIHQPLCSTKFTDDPKELFGTSSTADEKDIKKSLGETQLVVPSRWLKHLIRLLLPGCAVLSFGSAEDVNMTPYRICRINYLDLIQCGVVFFPGEVVTLFQVGKHPNRQPTVALLLPCSQQRHVWVKGNHIHTFTWGSPPNHPKSFDCW